MSKFHLSVRGFVNSDGPRLGHKVAMRGKIEAIDGREQVALFRSRLEKGSSVLSPGLPGKCGHSATRRNPAKRLAMLGHEGGKLPKILSCGFLRFPEDDIPVAHGNLRQHFSGSIV